MRDPTLPAISARKKDAEIPIIRIRRCSRLRWENMMKPKNIDCVKGICTEGNSQTEDDAGCRGWKLQNTMQKTRVAAPYRHIPKFPCSRKKPTWYSSGRRPATVGAGLRRRSIRVSQVARSVIGAPKSQWQKCLSGVSMPSAVHRFAVCCRHSGFH